MSVIFMVYIFVCMCEFKYVQGNTDDPVCGPGTYRSKFIGGDCLGCPQHWTLCQNEFAADVKSCEDACGELEMREKRVLEMCYIIFYISIRR